MYIKICDEKFKYHSPEYLYREKTYKKSSRTDEYLFKCSVSFYLFFIHFFYPVKEKPAKDKDKHCSYIVHYEKQGRRDKCLKCKEISHCHP